MYVKLSDIILSGNVHYNTSRCTYSFQMEIYSKYGELMFDFLKSIQFWNSKIKT